MAVRPKEPTTLVFEWIGDDDSPDLHDTLVIAARTETVAKAKEGEETGEVTVNVRRRYTLAEQADRMVQEHLYRASEENKCGKLLTVHSTWERAIGHAILRLAG